MLFILSNKYVIEFILLQTVRCTKVIRCSNGIIGVESELKSWVLHSCMAWSLSTVCDHVNEILRYSPSSSCMYSGAHNTG